MLLLPVIIATLFISFLIYMNWKRGRAEYKHELVGNCLLTKHPIVFLHGKKSLFYFFRYWNLIPLYLQNHGYEVIELSLSWRNSSKRKKEILNFLSICKKHNLGIHIIADSSSADELHYLASLNSDSVKSCTIVTNENDHNSYKNIRVIELSQSLTTPSFIQRTFVLLHNLINIPSPRLQPMTVGMTGLLSLSKVANAYLMHAISLAEIDARCSH